MRVLELFASHNTSSSGERNALVGADTLSIGLEVL